MYTEGIIQNPIHEMFILITTFECVPMIFFSWPSHKMTQKIRRQSYILNTYEPVLSSEVTSSWIFPSPSIWSRPIAALLRYHSILVSSRFLSPSDHCFMNLIPIQCFPPLLNTLDPLFLVYCGIFSKDAIPQNMSSIHICWMSERLTLMLSLTIWLLSKVKKLSFKS